MIWFLQLIASRYIIKLANKPYYIRKSETNEKIHFTSNRRKAQRFNLEEHEDKMYLDIADDDEENKYYDVKKNNWFKKVFAEGLFIKKESGTPSTRFYINDATQKRDTEIHWTDDICMCFIGDISENYLKADECENQSLKNFDIIKDPYEAKEEKEELNEMKNELDEYKNDASVQKKVNERINAELDKIEGDSEDINKPDDADENSKIYSNDEEILSDSDNGKSHNKEKNKATNETTKDGKFLNESTVKDIENIKLKMDEYYLLLKDMLENYKKIVKQNEERELALKMTENGNESFDMHKISDKKHPYFDDKFFKDFLEKLKSKNGNLENHKKYESGEYFQRNPQLSQNHSLNGHEYRLHPPATSIGELFEEKEQKKLNSPNKIDKPETNIESVIMDEEDKEITKINDKLEPLPEMKKD